ncbi:PREDICTED: pathogen-related protein [Theobroma cacao]|uniref:Pathogen-related protein n=1 Tax=Theobroma cacao TaxID=3641 RepID=A0AB32WSU2_THECC|nr:PREDICTED: pathogen-related protein [Theobroma cacao]
MLETNNCLKFLLSEKMASSVTQEDKYRSYLHGEGEKNTKWKFGTPPNYDVVNKLFEEGRTKIWPPGSLEEKVQNLVKTWEMEMFNKISFEDFKSINLENYTVSVNGRKPLTLEEKRKLWGGYNSFMQTSLPENLRGYNPAEETADSSHVAFTTAFPRGFALEVIQVYSGPPLIVYKFRHWGYMEGPFKGHAATGELVELYGISTVEVDEQMKILKIEFFFDRGELLGGLMKGAKLGSTGTDQVALSCPFLRKTG